MIVFWTLAGGLAVLALAFVLAPLLRQGADTQDPDSNALNLSVIRQQLAELDADLALGKLDQTQYDAARRDLERELIHDLDPAVLTSTAKTPAAGQAPNPSGRWAAPVLALAVPAAAVALYLGIGDTAIIPKLEAATGAQATLAAGGHGATRPDGSAMPSLDVLAGQLAERLEQDPNNPTGWVMLARTWSTLGDRAKALAAMDRGYAVAPKDPQILLAYAEALAEANGHQLAGKPVELLDSLLEVEPENLNGLWLRGMAAFQADDFKGALARWEPLMALLDPAGPDAEELSPLVEQARSRVGLAPAEAGSLAQAAAPATPAPVPTVAAATTSAAVAVETPTVTPAAPPAEGQLPQAAPAGPRLTVSVALDPALAAQVPQDATVFVYAKAVSGPPMPLAAQRIRAAELPATLTLDDSMAMMPQMRLSAFPQVTVGARISRTGQATPQSGDLEGEVTPVPSSQTETVAVTIGRVRP